MERDAASPRAYAASTRERGLLDARHRETRCDARECRRVTDARGREAPREERAERRDRARPTGRHHLDDVARADGRAHEHIRNERVGLREQVVDEAFEASARDARVDVDRAVVKGEDRRWLARQSALCGVRGHEDLVPELKLDRASQRGELALRSTLADEIV